MVYLDADVLGVVLRAVVREAVHEEEEAVAPSVLVVVLEEVPVVVALVRLEVVPSVARQVRLLRVVGQEEVVEVEAHLRSSRRSGPHSSLDQCAAGCVQGPLE